MNARFKNLVGSKRKSSSHNPSPSPQGGSTPTGQQRPTSLSPQATNSSSSSLPMNPQNPLGRPPSYTYAPPGGLGAPPPQHGRPTSPLPPINTGAPGYPPQQPMGYPPQGGPPGYPPQGGPPGGQYGQGGYGQPPQPPAAHGQQAAYGNRPAEVAGEGRSKAQLIVGIDFVSTLLCLRQPEAQLLIRGHLGHHLLRRRFRIRYQHRGQGRHHHRMARRGQSDETKGTRGAPCNTPSANSRIRFPRSCTTTSTRRWSDGARILLMHWLPLATLSPVCRRSSGSSCS